MNAPQRGFPKRSPFEAVYLTSDLVAQRTRVIDLICPKPGEHFLDIGVGPGLLAYDVARLVGPSGRVLGIDISTDMLAIARERLAPLTWTECREGNAVELKFADGSFDAAVSAQVYEYVADMPLALRELHRVLRPGGRVLILDTDWRSIVWHSSDNRLMERVLACWDDHLADPHLPATLGPMLTRSGFQVWRVEIAPMFSPHCQPMSYAAGILSGIYNFIRKNGPRHGLSSDEIAAWHADQIKLIDRQEFFFSLNRYVFVATR